MALIIVIAVLLISFAIEQGRSGRWKKDRLKDKPNYSNTYLDYFGMERDRKTDEPRFFSTDSSGNRIMYDKNHKVIKNLSEANEKDKFMALLPKAMANQQKAIELDLLPSEEKQLYNLLVVKKKYKDVTSKANYIVIKGSHNRGMDLVHYYYDFNNKKVVCPTDGFKRRFSDSKLCRVRNTTPRADRELAWQDVMDEIPKLQNDINKNGLDWASVCDRDIDYKYFR